MTRVISPNLGCPEIVDIEALNESGLQLILAVAEGESLNWTDYSIRASPAYEEEGRAFELAIQDAALLEEDGLPDEFCDAGATRTLISTALRARILPGHSFWRLRMRPPEHLGLDHLRTVNANHRATLFDLVLLKGDAPVMRVLHALFLRPANVEVRFVHLTDLHVAARNDLWAEEIGSIIDGSLQPPGQGIVNFNTHLRRFIQWANDQADAGELDFILATGDLIDFVRIGLSEREPGDNNWTILIDILTGSPRESDYGNKGLKVPIFTSPGNHDWRPLPYPPSATLDIFNITKKCARELDYLYHDTTEEVGKALEEANDSLVANGSPILAQTWWGSAMSFSFKGLQAGASRLWVRIKAFIGKYLKHLFWLLLAAIATRSSLAAIASKSPLTSEIGWYWLFAIPLIVVYAVCASIIPGWFKNWQRTTIEKLLALEAGVDSLSDYFLKINPYLNYAFRLENCYFIVLDTGHDCLIAQSFWDDGGKKIQRVTIRDNLLGGSPDTMGFYPPNENYPYSQIAWLERVLDLIKRNHDQGPDMERRCRVFVGLHAPPANLSKSDRNRADARLTTEGPFVLRPGFFRRFDIRYGTVNHYLSQFFYLCLGYQEGHTSTGTGPCVDVVFAGHAHWSIEFKLQRPLDAVKSWDPEVWYGKFSKEVEANTGKPDRWWGTLLLQTGACGPPSPTDPKTPNFRYVVVDSQMAIRKLQPVTM
jgi:hypothetical protein